MSRLVSIVLIPVFLLQMFHAALVIGVYECNKEMITELFCINKDKPELQCDGQCHLKQQLQEAEEQEQSPASTVHQKLEIQLFHTGARSDLKGVQSEPFLFAIYHTADTRTVVHSVFRPPRNIA